MSSRNHLSIHRLLLVFIFSRHLAFASVEGGQIIAPGSAEFWLFLGISAFLVCFAGVCSGLTVGYLSIKKHSLEAWLESPDQKKVKIAETILGILEHHHLLLSTLLLSNALAMEALPIFLDKIVPAYLAIFISTLAVLIFGEVIPQAYCTGPHQIPIAYFMSGFVKFLQLILGIFVRPIAWALDNWLGHHQDKIVFSKENLKTLLQLHKSKEFGYTPEEIELLQNTLDLRGKRIEKYMIPISKIMMLDLDITVDQNLFNTIQQYNFSVIPVYRTNKNRVLGVVRIKHLLGVDLNAGLSLKDCAKMEPVHFVPEGRNLLELYDVMKSRKGRYFFVVKDENRKYFSFSDKQQGKAITGMINMKIILEEITLKQFADQDQQKAVSSGEFAGMVKKKKPDELLEEGVEQD